MKRLALIFSWLTTAASACQAGPIPTIESFMGDWKITKVVGYADMSGGAPLGKQLLGQTLRITPDLVSLTLDHWKCKPYGKYSVREIDTASYLEKEAGAALEDAKLPPKAVMLDTGNCTTPFWIDQDHIEFDFLGVFVIAKRSPSVIDPAKP